MQVISQVRPRESRFLAALEFRRVLFCYFCAGYPSCVCWFRYTNQHDLKYQDSLGSALLQYARLVPGGILTFFPSYGLMEKMHERWKVLQK